MSHNCIMEAKLPPRKGYVETVDASGNHYYRKINSVSKIISRTEIITESRDYVISDGIISMRVTIVGGGGSANSLGNGGSGKVCRFSPALDRLNESVYISIGKAGVDGCSGEPTSFGTYKVAYGGISGDNESNNDGYRHEESFYGAGGTGERDATNGICIIEIEEIVKEDI